MPRALVDWRDHSTTPAGIAWLAHGRKLVIELMVFSGNGRRYGSLRVFTARFVRGGSRRGLVPRAVPIGILSFC